MSEGGYPGAETAAELTRSVVDSLSDAIVADEQFLQTVIATTVAGGHVLLEDVPGTGKTLTARSVARALDLSFSRVQFTPDLLPADVTGSSVYDEGAGEFEFNPGPIFGNVVLADEINRAPPKTQAALLEAMEEGQVTVEGRTHELPDPFIVIATQNPVEQEGTFPLPEAQLDRFWTKTSIGYPDEGGERRILDGRADRRSSAPTVERALRDVDVRALQETPEDVAVDGDLRDYMTKLARATREHEYTEVGVSPRGTQRLFEMSRAWAVVHGRDYVIPEDVADVAETTLAHRLVLTPNAKVDGYEKADVIEAVLAETPVPAVEG